MAGANLLAKKRRICILALAPNEFPKPTFSSGWELKRVCKKRRDAAPAACTDEVNANFRF